MRKLLLAILLLPFFAQSQTIYDTATIRSRVNAQIVPNGTQAITGQMLNDILNGYLNAWPDTRIFANYPLSWNPHTHTMSFTGTLTGVPTSRSITINGIAQDLSANRTWSVGTVTNVGSGWGLLGGPITNVGSLSADTSLVSSKWYTTSVYNAIRSRFSALSPIVYDPSTGQFSLTTVPVSKGGTGLTAVGTNGQVLRSNGTGLYYFTPNWLTGSDTISLSNRINNLTSAVNFTVEDPLYFNGSRTILRLDYFKNTYNARWINGIQVRPISPNDNEVLQYKAWTGMAQWMPLDSLVAEASNDGDTLALNKLITIHAGTGITIPETAGQLLGLPPVWTINADTTSVLATKWYVDHTGITTRDRFGFPGEDVTAGENRSFDLSTFTLYLNKNYSGNTLEVLNDGGNAIVSTGSSVAYTGFSSNLPAWFINTNTDTWWQPKTVLQLTRSGVNADVGSGVRIRFDNVNSAGTPDQSGFIDNTMSNVGVGTEVSDFEFYLVNGGGASIERKMKLMGSGQLKLDKYGAGTFAGTASYTLGVDASGNVIETSGGGGGGGSETDPLSLHLSDTSAVFTDLRNWIGADNGLSMSFNKVIWGGSSLYQNVEINGATDGNYYRIDFFNFDQFSAQSSFAFGDNGDGSNSQGGLITHGWLTSMWSGLQNNGSNSNIWKMRQDIYNDGSISGVAKYDLSLTNSSSVKVSEVYMDNTDYHVFANGLQIKHPTTASSMTARYSTISVSGNYADASGDILITATDYADNAAAIAGGLTAGKLYRTGDILKVVH